MSSSESFGNKFENGNEFDESLTVSAVEEQIKQVNEMLKAGEVSLKEALDLKESLEQKKSKIQLGDQVADSILVNLDNQGNQTLSGRQDKSNLEQTPNTSEGVLQDDLEAMPDYSVLQSANENEKKSGPQRSVGAMSATPDNELGSQKPLAKLSKEEIDTIVHDFGEKMNQSPKEYQDLYPKLKPYLKQQRKLERQALQAEIQNMSLDELEEKVDSEMTKMKRGDISQKLGYERIRPYVNKRDELRKKGKGKQETAEQTQKPTANKELADEEQQEQAAPDEVVPKVDLEQLRAKLIPDRDGKSLHTIGQLNRSGQISDELSKQLQLEVRESSQQSSENSAERERGDDKIEETTNMEQIKHQTDFFKEEPDDTDKISDKSFEHEPVAYPQITEQIEAFPEAESQENSDQEKPVEPEEVSGADDEEIEPNQVKEEETESVPENTQAEPESNPKPWGPGQTEFEPNYSIDELPEEVKEGEDGQSETTDSEPNQQEQIEQQERAEYLALKKQFKEAKADLVRATADDSSVLKKFGFGREKMSPEVQQAYDTFMAANKDYHNFAEQKGIFDKINDRISRKFKTNTDKLLIELDAANISREEFSSIESLEDVTALAESKNVSEDLVHTWLKEFNSNNEYDVREGIVNRHVTNPAQERLDVQTLRMPPMLAELKNKLVEKAKNHPNVTKVVATGFGGVMAVVNPFAMAAGFATRYAGNKLFIDKAEARSKEIGLASRENFFNSDSGELDLEQLEKEYFKSISDVDKYKVRTNTVAVAAAMAAGGAANAAEVNTPLGHFMDGGAPDNLPVDDNASPAEAGLSDAVNAPASESAVDLKPTPAEDLVTENNPSSTESNESQTTEFSEDAGPSVESEPTPIVPEAVTNKTEAIFEPHVIEKWDTTSEILLNSIKEKLNSGEIKLPEGVSRDEIAHRMYQTFPEMTSAQDVSPRLSADAWRELGIRSGDPNLIYPGETLDLQALVDEMWTGDSSLEVVPGASEQASAGFGEVSPAEANGVPEMYDNGQGSIEGYTTLSDADPTQVGQNEASAVAGSETSTAEVKPEDIKDFKDYHTPEVPPEKMFEMTDSAKEYVSEFLGPSSTKEEIFYKLISLVDGGEITLPEDLTIDGVDYRENLMGLVEKRLPELAPMKYVDVDPTLTTEEWARLGVPNGDPANVALQEGDKLMTGRLMQFVLSGDKSVLFPKP